MSTERPNILVFISHDTGRHISPYSVSTVRTPNCERVAEEGVLLENFFCTAPQCSPSRAAAFTGLYPHATGVHGLTHPPFNFDISPSVPHAARRFKNLGYDTFGTGCMHESTARLDDLGFDARLGENKAHAVPEVFREWLKARHGDAPFYAEIATNETHRPFPREDIPSDDSLGVTVPAPLEPTDGTKADYAAQQGIIKHWDEGLGKLLSVMDEAGISENTILVVTSDHGLAMPLAKGTLYDRGIGVMCMVRYPRGGVSGGIRLPELTSNVDLLPTLLNAAGAEIPEEMHGRSFWPLLTGGDYSPRDEIHAELTYHSFYKPMRCVRTVNYKYIRHFSTSVNHMIPNDVIPGGAYRDNMKMIAGYRLCQQEELFDLQADPDELNDLSTDPAHDAVRMELAKKLAHWMKNTDDPLLDGPIPSPFDVEGRNTMRELAE